MRVGEGVRGKAAYAFAEGFAFADVDFRAFKVVRVEELDAGEDKVSARGVQLKHLSRDSNRCTTILTQ